MQKKMIGITKRNEFLKYAQYSPELLQLEQQAIEHAKSVSHKKRYDALDVWYGYRKHRGKGFKQRVCKLVGWDSNDTRLNSSAAYDAVYDYILYLISDGRRDTACWESAINL